MKTLQGVIHGKTIELEQVPGLPDGEAVAVTIERVQRPAAVTKAEEIPWVELWVERLVFNSAVLPGERIVKGRAWRRKRWWPNWRRAEATRKCSRPTPN